MIGIDIEYEQIQCEILKKNIIMDFKETYTFIHHDVIHRTILNEEHDHLESTVIMVYWTTLNEELNHPESIVIVVC
jgi:hypothetical protein